jgi:hypothetical protein
MNNVEIFEMIMSEFRNRGFVTDPREPQGRNLYNPETKIKIHVGNIGSVSARIGVYDMIDDGMNWGKAHHILGVGTDIRFNFKDKTFDEFFKVTYTNRVNKLNKILENQK